GGWQMQDLERHRAVQLARERKEVADKGRRLLGREALNEKVSRRLVEDPSDLHHEERLGWTLGRTWGLTKKSAVLRLSVGLPKNSSRSLAISPHAGPRIPFTSRSSFPVVGSSVNSISGTVSSSQNRTLILTMPPSTVRRVVPRRRLRTSSTTCSL